jgi:predicted DNA-binding transcriptional regulator AlpA
MARGPNKIRPPVELPREGFASIAAVSTATTWAPSTVYLKVKKGEFPAPVKISPGRIAWPVEIVRAELAKMREAK